MHPLRRIAGMCALLALSPAVASAMNYTLGPVSAFSHPDGTTHYYQVGIITYNIYVPEPWRWQDAADIAASLTYAGFHGYLATITSAAERQYLNDNNLTRHGGYVGAEAVAGEWIWVTGPEAGSPVVFAAGEPLQCNVYLPCVTPTRLTWYPGLYCMGDVGVFDVGFGIRCAEERFLIEYGEVPPTPTRTWSWGQVRIIYR